MNENKRQIINSGSKNWLFSGSLVGAVASIGIYNLIETAKANGINSNK